MAELIIDGEIEIHLASLSHRYEMRGQVRDSESGKTRTSVPPGAPRKSVWMATSVLMPVQQAEELAMELLTPGTRMATGTRFGGDSVVPWTAGGEPITAGGEPIATIVEADPIAVHILDTSVEESRDHNQHASLIIELRARDPVGG